MSSHKYSRQSEISNIEDSTCTNTQLYSRPEDDAVSEFVIRSTNMKDTTAQKHMQ